MTQIVFSKYINVVKVSHYILSKKILTARFLLPLRSSSNSSNCEPILLLNNELKEKKAEKPKRKRRSLYSNNVSKLRLQTVGSGAPGAKKSLIVMIGRQGLLFNCGENTSRILYESNISIGNISHIFLTLPSWDNVSGIACLQEAISKDLSSSFVTYGPVGLIKLMNIFGKFRGDEEEKGVNYTDVHNDVIKIQDDFTVTSVAIAPSNKEIEFEHDNFVTRRLEKKLKNNHYALAYICKMSSNPGYVSIEALVDADVPPGPHIHKLREGKPATLEDGTVIYPEDVSKGRYDACAFIVIEIPNTDYLDSLVSCSAFDPFKQSAENSNEHKLEVIVHFSPSHVMKDPRYLQWVNSFPPSVSHLVLNDKNTCLGLQQSLKLQVMLHHLLPRVFPLLQDPNILENEKTEYNKNLPNPLSVTGEYGFGGPTVQTQSNLQYFIRPRLDFDSTLCPDLDPAEIIANTTIRDTIRESFSSSFEKMNNIFESLRCRGTAGPQNTTCDQFTAWSESIAWGRDISRNQGTADGQNTAQLQGTAKPQGAAEAQDTTWDQLTAWSESSALTQDISGNHGTAGGQDTAQPQGTTDNPDTAKPHGTAWAQDTAEPQGTTGDAFPNFIFLGTGSTYPSPKRNVSSILVNLSSTENILLDCGEGTYNQLSRFLGREQARKSLRQLQMVYSSHHHLDHFLGLPTLLLERDKAFYDVCKQPTELYLLASTNVLNYLKNVDRCYPILKNVQLVNNFDLDRRGKFLSHVHDRLLHSLRLDDLAIVSVPHCRESYGISLTNAEGVKFTYSGDTMPSEDLIEVGMGSDLLIHEATFEEGREEEANLKRHCTLAQALRVAKDMKAKFTILTHFSQRYQLLPLHEPGFPNNVGIAFDNMKVCLDDLPYLPHLYPTLEVLFAREIRELRLRKTRREN